MSAHVNDSRCPAFVLRNLMPQRVLDRDVRTTGYKKSGQFLLGLGEPEHLEGPLWPRELRSKEVKDLSKPHSAAG